MGNTALHWHHDRLLALTEGGVPYLLRLEEDGTVQSMGAYTFEGDLDHNFTAHPKVDPKTGEMLSFVNAYVRCSLIPMHEHTMTGTCVPLKIVF